jgi:hypothetical protein
MWRQMQRCGEPGRAAADDQYVVPITFTQSALLETGGLV